MKPLVIAGLILTTMATSETHASYRVVKYCENGNAVECIVGPYVYECNYTGQSCKQSNFEENSEADKPAARCTRGLLNGGYETYDFFKPFSAEAFVQMETYAFAAWVGEYYLIFKGKFPAHFEMKSWVTYNAGFNPSDAIGEREFEFSNHQSPSQGTMRTGDGQKYQVRCELLDQRGDQ